MSDRQHINQVRTLQSWKEIAQYVGRGVRTVQRWEELGIPVRRRQWASRKSTVYAIATELDAWLMNNPVTRPWDAAPSGSSPAGPLKGCRNGLHEVLITHKLSTRPVREHDKAARLKALKAVANEVPGEPDKILGALANHALELCCAGSTGLSVLHKEDHGQNFHWDFMAGVLRDCVGKTTPRAFSPCGVTLDRKSPQLFAYPAKCFDCLSSSPVPLVECLVVPIFVSGKPLATIWIVSHEEQCQFNNEDVVVLTSLAAFCETALTYMDRHSQANSGF